MCLVHKHLGDIRLCSLRHRAPTAQMIPSTCLGSEHAVYRSRSLPHDEEYTSRVAHGPHGDSPVTISEGTGVNGESTRL